ncbi:MAG: DUF3179 domain-containing protein [Gemmatimonadota bacterium]
MNKPFPPHRRAPGFLLAVLLGSTGVLAFPGFTDASALSAQEEWKTDFSRITVDPEEIVSGGPPKDGIPAIDHPKFVSIKEANRYVDGDEPVAVVRMNGEVKAYPIQILIWHEIVNDVVGGVPVTVTYCPLCNTTLAFDRRFSGEVLDFGTTGRLRHSDLIMYDRQTETWWQQATGEGIVGALAGQQLTFVPSPVMRWKDVKEQLPDAKVLSRDTGFPGYLRRYGVNPYKGYDRSSGPMKWTFKGKTNPALPQMERVVALYLNGAAMAVPFSVLRKVKMAQLTVGGKEVVVFFQPRTLSSLDGRRVMDGRSVGSSAVYDPVVEGRTLHFVPGPKDAIFTDTETGSVWNMAGKAVEGPLAGTQLAEITHGNHFWFAWSVFRPETDIWRPGEGAGGR